VRSGSLIVKTQADAYTEAMRLGIDVDVTVSGPTLRALRIPMVVGPRYNPAPVLQTVDLRTNDNGWGVIANDPVPDRERVSPPVLDPLDNAKNRAPVNPTTISIRLQAGFPLGEVKSHFHNVKIDSPDSATRVITVADGAAPADRDDAEQKPLPREVVFVIDNSGSMGGTSIAQAKAGLLFALSRLQPGDRFNVIRFDHTMGMLFADVVAADSEHLAQAKAFVTTLQAAGGTEMIPPMRAALTDHHADGNGVRQVIFLTDGCIGNEQQLFDTIAAMRGRSRVFMVGIGSAPNSYLMTRAAELGRGTYTHIGSVEQVESRMRELFGKLESPAVTQLSVTFSDTKADLTPDALPDLYRGESLVLSAKLGGRAGTMQIKGRIGDRPWSVTMPLAGAAEGKGLSKLWARRKIADAEVAQTTRTVTADAADKTILALALEHQLVTRLTSLVAVDQTPSRPMDEPLKLSELPLNLPAGWDFEKVFGERPKPVVPAAPATERRAHEQDGRVRIAVGGASPAVSIMGQPQQGVVLPATATDAPWKMILGAVLMTFALMVVAYDRRRRAFRLTG
jgi:Ca-activated chloride channel family protein